MDVFDPDLILKRIRTQQPVSMEEQNKQHSQFKMPSQYYSYQMDITNANKKRSQSKDFEVSPQYQQNTFTKQQEEDFRYNNKAELYNNNLQTLKQQYYQLKTEVISYQKQIIDLQKQNSSYQNKLQDITTQITMIENENQFLTEKIHDRQDAYLKPNDQAENLNNSKKNDKQMNKSYNYEKDQSEQLNEKLNNSEIFQKPQNGADDKKEQKPIEKFSSQQVQYKQASQQQPKFNQDSLMQNSKNTSKTNNTQTQNENTEYDLQDQQVKNNLRLQKNLQVLEELAQSERYNPAVVRIDFSYMFE